MADQKKRISELPLVGSTDGLMTLGVNAQNESVKVPLGDLLKDYNNAVTEASEAKAMAEAATATAGEAENVASEAKAMAEAAKSTAEEAVAAVDSIQATATEAKDTANNAGLAFFNGIIAIGNIKLASTETSGDVVYVMNKHVFAMRVGDELYGNWQGADAYLNSTRTAILKNKVYAYGKNLYVWDDTTSNLVMAGTDPSAVEGKIADAIAPRTFINVNAHFGTEAEMTLDAALARFSDDWVEANGYQGTVLTFKSADGFETWQFKGGTWTMTDCWRKFGGSASVGNCYNVTNDEPISGYYSLETAIATAFDKGYTSVGIQITFSVGKSTWKTYQYVGASTSETDFKNPNNWLDLAGMSAGDETLINVDLLCGACSSASYYTLEYAIAAINALQIATGITYAKSGLVITYKVADNTWETKQFKGEASDFGEAALWQDFGSGAGSDIQTSDTPEVNGSDAFSTGGAYNTIPTTLSVDTETEGVVKLSMRNAANQTVGDEIQFPVGTGSGSGGATIVYITPEASPFYGQAGSDLTFRASIRSVTAVGNDQQTNLIERVELYDRDSNQLLETKRFNQASSLDSEDYSFLFNLSSYFTMAGSRRFKFVAYDDSGNTGSRNVNVTAVDVTIKSEQTLHYTASTVVLEGGAIKSLPMYRFPNNASDQGILCTVEIFLGGEWQILGTATISDTYSHSISVNPNNCVGSVLTHGAYPIRIHGVDIASGVVGNYLHTAIMVVNQSNTTPIVVTRWLSETESASVKQYESISMDFAVYNPLATQQEVYIIENADSEQAIKQSTTAYRSVTYTYTQRVQGYETDGSVTISLVAKANDIASQEATFRVLGSLLNISSVSTQLVFDMDMASRSNSEADKTISDGGYSLVVNGSNYSTNGFVKDSYGTEEYGTENDKGNMALRIAENVTATLDYKPFSRSDIETNGMAIQFRIRTKHIADDTARLISCMGDSIGFYVTGKEVVLTFNNATARAKTITAALEDDSITDVAIVIEPTSQAPYAGIGIAKLYFDGELIGACFYDKGTLATHSTPITFDGSSGDLYLYNIRAWHTYYSFEESFNNYLLKLSDSESMIKEYNYNLVMASQAAEGKPATNRPQAASLHAIGIPYFVVCKNAATDNVADNYPDYLETLNGDKKTKRIYDIYAYFPNRPWQDFKAIGVTVTNQGTTSSMRPVKNIKMKFKDATLTLLHDRSEFSGEELLKYDECAANAAQCRVQPLETSLPTNIITVKVDYSESGGANNGASTELYNVLQRAMGENYMTPAQNAYEGKYVLNTSIDSIPCAFFRTDMNSDDATSPSYGYFHAKGNWNYDKGDPRVFGFEDVEGYNKGCLNYGDFVEVILARDKAVADITSSELSSMQANWDTSQVYLLSEFCGSGYKFYRYKDGKWADTTGAIKYTGGKWVVTGDVLNPVENYELLAYNAMDWFQGVSTVDDMLAPTDPSLDENGEVKDPTPLWLTYFESRYPDDDYLNQAYKDGRKVPYQLFRWLQWCNECNQHKSAEDGNITIDGESVSGTAENRLLKFKRELHTVANVHSMICYHVFTDYLAAVDQRSKNMMIGFYLEKNGSTRMYLNHLYDGDTILGSDNDCGLTIPALLDPNNDPNGYYQGHDSVLFTQLSKADYIWLEDYTSDSDTTDSTKTVSVASVSAAMRTVQLSSGLRPFSPQGLEKYWITDRLSKWPKLVSSYDGIRKYIDHSTADDNYFYALHGLSIQRLQDFIKTRFLYRDGYYQCGDTYASAISMRCTGTNMSVTIKAAKRGFFGIGVDRANEARQSVYLEEGETATLLTGNTNLGSGVMLYIFGANCIEELDITNATPKQSGWSIKELTLLKKLTIGGADYTPATSTGDELSTLALGQLPFLEEIDLRNFPITSVDATYCPRLKTVKASGSTLQTIALAETSPIATLELPATMTALSLVNLPNLSYPNGGLTIAGFTAVKRLQIEGCPNVDALTLLDSAISDGANISQVRVTDLKVTTDATVLNALKASGAKGIGTDLDNVCDGLTGTWILNSLMPESEFNPLAAYFPALKLHNAQFTAIVFDDTISDPKNVTNLDNNTTGESYTASGHMVRIREALIPVKGKLNTNTGKWEGIRISNGNYHELPNGTEFDYKDELGEGFDVMMRIPDCWYKGVNDFKNQKKYIFWSSLSTEPLSTADNVTRKKLKDIVHAENCAVMVNNVTTGVSTLDSEGVLSPTPNYNVYQIKVRGMKQVRYPGVNHSQMGGVFLDADGVIISTYNMAVSNALFDFVEGEYIFIDVPDGAEAFVFGSKATHGELEAIAVDSKEVEAIEPDWVHHDACLGGVYHASVDALRQLRSISGANVCVGTGTAKTSEEWLYDSEGNPTNTPLGTLNYTGKDLMNLAARRGQGYQLFDYEMSKFIAILYFSMTGNRDAQLLCGYGRGSGGTTGSQDALGNTDSKRATASNGNKCLGFENFFGCTWEFMDNVGVNIRSFAEWKIDQCPDNNNLDIVNAVWHIYDPITKTERTVQGITSSGVCIGRVKHGRYCDVIASKCTSDSSVWASNYADGQWYSASRGRVVGRSGFNSSALGGLVCASASYASSGSYSSSGSRLAFRGEIVISED